VLRRIELEVLATVDRGDTISELATKLDHSVSYLSRAVGDLVEKARLHGTRRPAKTSRPVSCSCRRTLSGPRPPALPHRVPRAVDRQGTRGALLSRPATNRRRIADRSDNYRNTVNRVLKRFRNCGLVGTDDGRYDFNGDFDRLHEFARELAHHLHRQRLESVAPKGTILWEDHDKFLAQTETEIDAEGSTKPGSLDSRPSTSSSSSPTTATTSTPNT